MAKRANAKPKRKKTGKNSSLNNRRTNEHHIVSRAVGGPDIPENLYRHLIKWHNAWHQLFGTYLPSVVIGIIQEWTKQNGELYEEKMGRKNVKAWETVFQKRTPQEAINFIEKEFLPVEKKFLAGKLGGDKDVRKFKRPRKQ